MNGAPSPHHRSGEGEPLVCLHGFTGTWHVWDPVLPALTAAHDVYAPTLPDHHGGPPIGRANTTVAELTDGVERMLDAQGIEAAHLVGNSLGGWLALELGRRGRALSVVALSPAGAWTEEEDLHRVVHLIREATRQGIRLGPYIGWTLNSGALRKAFLRPMMEHGERMPAATIRQMMADPKGCIGFDEILQSIHEGGFQGLDEPLDCRVRIAWGDCDRTIPFDRYGEPYRTLVPGAEFIVMEGVGHVPMFDDPALVARTILRVTAGLELAPLLDVA
ncbi:alpha/beta fold hydrolase [Paraconexibacter antarcticus]|uniref:Alpha/beta fold hydrolase n=1 Tax=Paraconexibacter antarcticus TaxID=2949664 RepID=A0ABY5DNJ9_9ACTN|nr:alpha/beta fold hydrolase [Paraconexibacter antarcticus]UTI63606.1 alpha/beta fold hydrolase [Paraconexibacter antarcticus]